MARETGAGHAHSAARVRVPRFFDRAGRRDGTGGAGESDGAGKGTEVDQAAADAVKELIAALPATITLENQEAVEAARAAYGALTEEQKALVDNLAVLEAAEAVIEELLEGSSGPETEIPEETCTVDYKAMSDGVSYDGHTGNSKDGYVFNYTIHEGASGDLVIDLAQCALDLWKNESQIPGDHYKFQILVKNESEHVYRYKDGSFTLAPEKTDKFGSLEEGSLLPVLTYDGQYMPIRFSGAMIPEYFYEDVFHVNGSASVTFEMFCQIYDYLEDAGYTGETAITDYLLDYFNNQRGVNYSSLTDLFADHPDWLDGSKLTKNGIYTMTESKLLEYIEKYPWIDRFVYVGSQSGGNLGVQIKWPEPEISAVSYNSFYMGLFSVVYGEENANILNPNPSGDLDFARSHAVGDYMPGTALYEETNQYFTGLTADKLENGETLEIWSGYGIDGPGMGNSYQNYSFTYYNVIELEQQDTSYQVVHEYYTKKDGKYTLDGQFISDAVDAMVGDQVNAADLEKLTGYSGKTYTYVSANPATLAITSDADKNVLTLRYEREEKKEESSEPEESYPPRPDPDPSDPDEEIPDESTPTTSGPDGEVVPEGPGGDGEEIPDESTPLTSVPTEDIDDDETPVTAPPKTGSAATSASLILAAASALGLVLLRKKK